MGESLWSRAQEVQPVDDAGDDPLHPRLEMFRREPPNLSAVCRVWAPCMRAWFRCNDGEGILVGREGEMGPVTATPGVVHTAAHTPRAAFVPGREKGTPPVSPDLPRGLRRIRDQVCQVVGAARSGVELDVGERDPPEHIVHPIPEPAVTDLLSLQFGSWRGSANSECIRHDPRRNCGPAIFSGGPNVEPRFP